MNQVVKSRSKAIKHGKRLMALACASALFLIGTAEAADLLGARIGRHPDKTRLVLDLSAKTSYVTRYLEGYRIEISLSAEDQVTLAALQKARAAGLISAITPSSRGLILTLKGPAKVAQSFPLSPEDPGDAPFRIVIDLVPISGDAWARLLGPDAAIGNLAAAKPAVVESPPAAPIAPPEDTPPPAPTLMPVASDERLFDGLSLDGYAEIEGRVFLQSSRDPGPGNAGVSLALAPTVSYAWNDGRMMVVATPFARLDSNDSDRTHFDMREAKFVAAMGRFELRAGIDKQFWGVVESQHLVDILNQNDALEDIDGEDKLGQLMGSVSYDSDFGTFSAYVMSNFRERRFAGANGRPRAPFAIAYDLTQYESSADKWHVDWALRWSNAMGPIDMALSYFKGTNRKPLLLIGLNARGEPVIIPRYNLIEQAGLELQGTFGPLLLKAEAIRRTGENETATAAIAGFEYTLFNIWGSSDLGILSEYLWDSRSASFDNPFNNDLFFGLRWSGNDIRSTTLLVGSIFDLRSAQKYVTIEGSRRVGDGWTVALEGRLFLNVPQTSPLYIYSDDSFFQLKLQRHF
ncbi:hypothetical protein [Govanella unica]|uniref:AMIN domain-containing protein n=1 Tax=Govanella unica TaxID=2975056 RepID=A0A9X3TZH7_9PROT|nr:hypothetical protein [Govania unica]MDA5194605.1 hypothetical protein [Govania unica]